MNRKQAWSHYFTTGDKTPLVEAYWDSINYIAWERYRSRQEDMFQVGMMGLLKAIDKLDPKRVKSLDAWVFLNVRNMMFNARTPKVEYDLDGLYEVPSTEDEYNLDLIDHPARERFVLKMIYEYDYKRTEIAEILAISSARVGQLERQALKRLVSPTTNTPFRDKQPPKPCAKCGTEVNPLRRGMCRSCYDKDRSKKFRQ